MKVRGPAQELLQPQPQGTPESRRGKVQFRGRGGGGCFGAHQHPPGPRPPSGGWCGACRGCAMMMVAVLSWISLRQGGVPGVIQHPDRELSLECKDWRSFSGLDLEGKGMKALRGHGVISGHRSPARKLGRRQGPGSGIRWLSQSIAHDEPQMLYSPFISCDGGQAVSSKSLKPRKQITAKCFELLQSHRAALEQVLL